jgi:phosphatidylglycerophosphate synthase
MPLPSLAELERRCQKPDHASVGTWMARRIGRPAALRVTWIVAPLGLSANAATLTAWGLAFAAAAALAWGSVGGWLLAAVLLQAWYLADHVDGQLARLRGTSSLDGSQLDYLMHHTVNLLIPLGTGCGLFVRTLEPLWALAGLGWGLALLLITLQHDARYKAFLVRLKRLHGRLEVLGGGGCRPLPPPPVPRRPLRLLAWLARKACELHVVMNLLLVTAVVQWALGDWGLIAGRCLTAVLALMAAVVAAWDLIRSQSQNLTEQEFALWFRVPPAHHLTYRDGWWFVEN